MGDTKFHFGAVLAKIKQTQNEVPKLLANQAQNEFVGNFNRQGFNGTKWQEVKRRIAGTPEYKYPKSKGLSRRKKPILTGSGAMKRAVSNMVTSPQSKINGEGIKLVVTVPVKTGSNFSYPVAHNEGTAVIPQRQFVGQTPALTEKQKALITKYFAKIWQA
jgi:phage gpG-like protein